MVRMATRVKANEDIGEALRRAHPELDAVRAASEQPVYLVGGAVRDLLLGRPRADVDLVVVGDASALAAKLGADPVEHERFATAKTTLDGHEVDIASARSESYAQPGALPDVEPAAEIETDLARRDFTINAMALPLDGAPEPIDPHGGRADLEAGLLRVLHERSFEDDPTRALRAARYAARFGFELEPRTEELLREADLNTISRDRKNTELLRLAAERNAARGFALLSEWGLIELRPEGAELVEGVTELLAKPAWEEFVADQRDRTVLVAALGPPAGETALLDARPERPSIGFELARRRPVFELVLARALGAEWLDRYLEEWREVRLEIDGSELIAAGIPEGPAVGRGLEEAQRRKLDGEIAGREEELAVALEAAREAG
jgi:tRNA nucleotidyltransferase (CCA-adding enzyme)